MSPISGTMARLSPMERASFSRVSISSFLVYNAEISMYPGRNNTNMAPRTYRM